MQHLWNTDEFVTDASLTVLVSRLRSKLRDISGGKEIIGTKKEGDIIYYENVSGGQNPCHTAFFVAFLFVNLYFGVICATRVNISDLLYLDVIGTALAVTVFLADYRKYRRLCRTLACEQDIPKEEIKKLLGHQPYEIWCRRKEADEEKIQSLYNEILN